MRLINTTTLELKEFFDSDIPKYAILSHRWTADEVTYEEYMKGKHPSGVGYQKIVDLCMLAREGILIPGLNRLGFVTEAPISTCFEYAWIDTICIDKRSSAELSEAVNSMYRWYEQAEVCLAFLPDVTAEENTSNAEDDNHIVVPGHSRFLKQQFLDSVWFTRGWTLQELVAPKGVLFYDVHLHTLGWKQDYYLQHVVADAARIDVEVLSRPLEVHRRCTAQKLAWVAHRKTSRAEDMAYCLLGLVGINMPLLYGEGLSGAFQRLQLEIIASKTDQTISAFDSQSTDRGMFAHSPAQFLSCGNIHEYFGPGSTTFARTQRGLEFDLSIPRGIRPRSPTWFALLPVATWTFESATGHKYVVLRIVPSSYQDECMHAQRMETYHIDPDVYERNQKLIMECLLGWRTLGKVSDEDWQLPEAVIQYNSTRMSPSLGDRGRRLLNKLLPAKRVRVYASL